MKKVLRAILMFLLPASVCRMIFRLFEVRSIEIGKGCRIGFSLLLANEIKFEKNMSIGHLNYVNINKLRMGGGKMHHLNIIKGRMDMVTGKGLYMHSQNKITAPVIDRGFYTMFEIKDNVSFIMKHTVDLTDSVTIGEHTTVAGVGTQIWSHAFYIGKKRTEKVLGRVEIGRNCYIGSNVIICAGVTIGDNIAIGANATVSKDLTKPGLYVNQALRFIEYDGDKAIDALGERPASGVYRKSKKE